MRWFRPRRSRKCTCFRTRLSLALCWTHPTSQCTSGVLMQALVRRAAPAAPTVLHSVFEQSGHIPSISCFGMSAPLSRDLSGVKRQKMPQTHSEVMMESGPGAHEFILVLSGVIEGFGVGAGGAASLLWSVAFPPSTEAILATATPGLHDPVYSYAKVCTLHDLPMNLLVRYMNLDVFPPRRSLGYCMQFPPRHSVETMQPD